MNNKENDFEILNELIYESEQSTTDMLSESESFLNKICSPNTKGSNLQKVNQELRSEIEGLKNQLTGKSSILETGSLLHELNQSVTSHGR